MAAGALAGVGIFALTGCGEQDEFERAVTDAGITLVAPQSGVDEAYSDVLRSVPSSSGSESGTASAGAVMRATALLGQGTTSFSEASTAERRLGYQAEALRVLARRWTALNQRADAARAFDPSGQIDELRAESRTREAEVAVLEAERRDLQAEIDALNAYIDSRLERAAATRADAGELRVQAATLSAQEAAERAVQIRQLTRTADQLESDALRSRARAEVKQPELDEVEARIGQRTEQRRVIATAIGELTARSDVQRTRAIEYRDRADELAAAIEAAATGLRSSYEDTLRPLIESSRSLLENASREARGAGSDFAAGLLTQSAAEQRLADLARLEARASGFVAEVFTALAGVEPALPGAAGYASYADERMTRVREATAEASERFAAASSAARRIRATGDGREAVQRLADRLDAAASGGQSEADPADGGDAAP